jgi:arylesterase/paraoxonase
MELNQARAFFISNDHFYYNGLSRQLEDTYGPFRWASQVVYCAGTDRGFNCKIVSPKNAHPYANGILLVDQGKTVMVNDVIHGSVTAYDINLKNKYLTPKQTIVSITSRPLSKSPLTRCKFLGAAPDNLSEDSVSGDLIVSGQFYLRS